MGIISKLKKENLLGRSGSAFPTGLKWEAVKNAKAKKKYIICNGSEGEPGISKDGFILKNYLGEVVKGVKIALETINNSCAYIYLRKDYFRQYEKPLKKIIGDSPIIVFKKKGGYLAGEETCVCEVIEGKSPEPRIKPPFPSQAGLWGCPTLINNLETFYCVAKIAAGDYKKTRFYSISGHIQNQGDYELPEDLTIEEILKKTGNWPDFDFFVHAGGGASGEILLSCELNRKIKGIGGIIVLNKGKTDLLALMTKWIDFFLAENCDKCVPCREGVYRIAEMLKKGKIDKKLLSDFLFVLEQTSFCPLGKSVAGPFKGLTTKLLNE